MLVRLGSAFAFVLLVAASGIRAQADVIELKSGSPVKARVWDRNDSEVSFNVFRTGIRTVTHGTEKLASKAIKKIVEDSDPNRSFWRRGEALVDQGKADDWVSLGRDARAQKLNGCARLAFLQALTLEPNHAEAIKELGEKAKSLIAADPRLNESLKSLLARYLETKDFAERSKLADSISKAGSSWSITYLERAYRSSKERKVRTDDRPLTLRSKEHKGIYTLFVPPNYDPFKPTPLVVGLHGGGRGGKDGKEVVGSGSSAMNFYQNGAARLGWLVVCPSAIEAPWSAKLNDGFLLSVVDEISMLFNVDLNRVYLTGHSMGGYGTWHFGPLYATKWAAISPMAGGGVNGLNRLEDMKTGVYLYHGANDPVVGVGEDRAAANEMKKADMDFVYAEIPDSGHGFPAEVEAEMWAFFKPRRLAMTEGGGDKGKFVVTELPRSSFELKLSKDELEAFGALGKAEAASDPAAEFKKLLDDLRAGGGRAERAVEPLGAHKDPESALAVAKALSDPKAADDVKRYACDALGRIGKKEAAKALTSAMADKDLKVCGAAGAAFGRLEVPDKGKTYDRAVADLKKRFDATKTGETMTFPDFELFCDAVARFSAGIEASTDPSTSPALQRIGEDFLLPKLKVDSSERAGQDPSRPRRLLARAIVSAAVALKAPALRPLLEKIAARPDLGAQSEAQEALR